MIRNIPEVKLGVIAVSRSCFPASLSARRRAALCAAFADKRIAGLVSELGGVFGMVLGIVGACALMLFISIISVTKAVAG